jgi:hypothetical protein
VAAGFGPLGHEDIDAGTYLLDGVLLRPHQRGDRHAFGLGSVDHELRRNTERVGDQLDGMAK